MMRLGRHATLFAVAVATSIVLFTLPFGLPPGPGLLGFMAALLLIPGAMVATVLAPLISPQGFHGIDDVSYVVRPCSWLFYFLVARLLLKRAGGWHTPSAGSGNDVGALP